MNTGRKRSLLSYIPGYSQNAVIQLIIASGVAFVMLGMIWGIILIVYQGDAANFNTYFLQNIALPSQAGLKSHWWTVFTYGWFHFNGFFDLLSNMLWLYCFGSVVQMLVGYRHVIPLFAYSMLAGALAYVAAQYLPGDWGKCPPLIMGPRAALVGMAAAAVTLTPNYRFYLTETFRVHMLVVAGIFGVLMILSSGFYLPVIILLLGGGLMGFAYIKLLKAGYRPGDWMYTLSTSTGKLFDPDNNPNLRNKNRSNYEPKTGISQKRIDDILDKINQKGYQSLSSEEKDILLRAGKE